MNSHNFDNYWHVLKVAVALGIPPPLLGHNFDSYWHVLKERQVELAFELQKEVWLRDPDRAPGARRRALLSLAATAVLVAVIVAASVYLLG